MFDAAAGPATFADVEGRFEIEAPGRGRLRISAAGFLDGHVDLTPARDRELGRLVLRAALSLRGRLVQDGDPVAGALVYAPPEESHGIEIPLPETVTDARGRFVLDDLRPEKLRSLIFVVGGLARRLDLGHGLWPVDARPYDLGDVEFPGGREVTGQVFDDAGDPVAGATVWPVDVRGPLVTGTAGLLETVRDRIPRPKATTDADGRFRLFLLPGDLRLAVLKPGYELATRWFEVAAADAPEERGAPAERAMSSRASESVGTAITSRSRTVAQTVTTVESGVFALSRGVTGAGRVVDAEGRPLAGVRVSLDHVTDWPSLGRAPIEPPAAETDADGCYRLAGLPAGADLRLVARAPGYVEADTAVRLPDGPAAASSTRLAGRWPASASAGTGPRPPAAV